jgi:tripartite-type tricarboxylate transporter receptor subunit TctC
MRFFRYSLMLVSALSVIAPAFGQEKFPARVVTIVVPFPPGGGTDTGARLIAQKLSERWGQQVIVDNKPGAAGSIGASAVAKAKPDGYTLLMGNIGTQSINPSLYKNLPYNPETAFAPVTLIAELPLVLLVNPTVAAKSPKELIELAKSKPAGQMTYSSSGSGGSMHLAGELFQDASAVQLLHVPYKGGGPALVDLMAGHVNLAFATILESIGFIKGGKLRALAVTSDKRSPALPEVPTLAESGFPGYNSISWIGLLAPAGTPQSAIDKVAADVREVLAAADVSQRLIEQGATPVASSPAQFKSLIENDRQRYAKIIQDKGIKPE